jgi:hypothetical protein
VKFQQSDLILAWILRHGGAPIPDFSSKRGTIPSRSALEDCVCSNPSLARKVVCQNGKKIISRRGIDAISFSATTVANFPSGGRPGQF